MRPQSTRASAASGASRSAVAVTACLSPIWPGYLAIIQPVVITVITVSLLHPYGVHIHCLWARCVLHTSRGIEDSTTHQQRLFVAQHLDWANSCRLPRD